MIAVQSPMSVQSKTGIMDEQLTELVYGYDVLNDISNTKCGDYYYRKKYGIILEQN